ncbi:MAG: tyrosine-type recombinase/integrase [Eubacteriaceae bacterium]|nr:tyrosine-type recombinase/integrase [Eubacteriaceae bacterium]
MKELLEEFSRELSKDHSPDTVKGYLYDIGGFTSFISEHFDVSEKRMREHILSASENDVFSYLNYLVTAEENSPSTVNRKLSSIRRFYSFLYNTRRIESDFTRNIKSVKTTGRQDIFTLEELQQILSAVKGRNRERDLVILGGFIYAGLTVNEIIGLRKTDLTDDGYLNIETGRSSRTIKLNSAYREIIRQHLQSAKDQSPWMVTANGIDPMNKRTVHQVVTKYLKSCGLYRSGLTTETLRRSGVYLLRKYAGFDITDVKDYLGLKSSSSLRNYEFEENSRAQDRIDRIPLTNMKLWDGKEDEKEF